MVNKKYWNYRVSLFDIVGNNPLNEADKKNEIGLNMENIVVGWEEWVTLPELGLPALKAKTDTGARTSALHAFSIQPFGSEKKPFVRFGIHPVPDNPDIEVFCSARVVDRREVTSSNGQKELRYVIKTPIIIGKRKTVFCIII